VTNGTWASYEKGNFVCPDSSQEQTEQHHAHRFPSAIFAISPVFPLPPREGPGQNNDPAGMPHLITDPSDMCMALGRRWRLRSRQGRIGQSKGHWEVRGRTDKLLLTSLYLIPVLDLSPLYATVCSCIFSPLKRI